MNAPRYTITESLPRDGRAMLHRAIRNADRCPVVLKVLDPRRSRPKDLDRLKHEYEIGRLLDAPTVVRPLDLEAYQGMPVLVLEDFGGDSLDQWMGAPMPVDRFLPLAIGITKAIRKQPAGCSSQYDRIFERFERAVSERHYGVAA